MRAFFLVGPTAVGKSSVAHHLACQLELPVISADSMAVYRGLDIGTAKPSPAERTEVDYYGIDLVHPDQEFSTADWLRALPKLDQCIVVGGTGLYVKALLAGLDPAVPADPELRARLANADIATLQTELRSINPNWLDGLADPENPRRLIRAIERAAAGEAPPAPHIERPPLPLIHGLWRPPEVLRERIRKRVDTMFENGLFEENWQLRETFPVWSKSASGAIGYKEIMTGDHEAERQEVATRTNQLAKRQRTWFRNQLNVEWIEVKDDDTVQSVAERVRAAWQSNGPVTCKLPEHRDL